MLIIKLPICITYNIDKCTNNCYVCSHFHEVRIFILKKQIATVVFVHNVVYTMQTVLQKRNFVCLKLVMVGERS